MDWKRIAFVLIVALTMAGTVWFAYHFASQEGLNDYIGDEVWYVPASRNVLHLLGINVTYEHNGTYGVNVIFTNDSEKFKYLSTADAVAAFSGVKLRIEYYEFPGVYYEIPKGEYRGFLKKLSLQLPQGSYYVVPGFRYPDKEDIQNYLNTEHPPSGISVNPTVDEPRARLTHNTQPRPPKPRHTLEGGCCRLQPARKMKGTSNSQRVRHRFRAPAANASIRLTPYTPSSGA